MADPTPPADGAPVPSEDTETGRAKHMAPLEGDAPVDRPGVARAATGPDAVASDPPATAAEPAAPAPAAVPAGAAAGDGPVDSADALPPRGDVTATPATRVPAADDGSEARAEAAEARADAATARADAAETRTERLDRSDDRTAALPSDERPTGPDSDRTAVLPADRADESVPPPPAPRQAPTPVPPADAPLPPRRGSNRLVGTAWVLLAALLFEVLYLAAYALLIVIVYGAANVGPALASLNKIGLTWLPVVLFALFYELTVLLLNRAGRFAYVLSSLIVAVIVYLLATFLALAMQAGGIGNESSFGQALIAPQIVLIPLVAREVMLWTGLAIGARGRRVRQRDREAREAYERDRFASSVRGSDDGVRADA